MHKRPYSRRLSVDDLIVDDRYQRDLKQERVNKIAAEYDPRRVDGLVVSARKNGKYAVLDGQHRLEVLRAIGARTVLCIVHDGLSIREEAEMFDLLNTERVRPSPLEIFKARVFRGAEPETSINAIVRERGFGVVDGARASQIRAVGSLRRAYRRGNLAETIDLVGVWTDDFPNRISAEIVGGLSLFLHSFGEIVDARRLRTVLKVLDPAVIKARAYGISRSSGGGSGLGREQAARIAIMELYNKRLGSSRRLRLVESDFLDDDDDVEEAVGE